jgi:hypothetical protein
MNVFERVLVGSAALALVACGGGGGGEDAPSAPTPPSGGGNNPPVITPEPPAPSTAAYYKTDIERSLGMIVMVETAVREINKLPALWEADVNAHGPFASCDSSCTGDRSFSFSLAGGTAHVESWSDMPASDAERDVAVYVTPPFVPGFPPPQPMFSHWVWEDGIYEFHDHILAMLKDVGDLKFTGSVGIGGAIDDGIYEGKQYGARHYTFNGYVDPSVYGENGLPVINPGPSPSVISHGLHVGSSRKYALGGEISLSTVSESHWRLKDMYPDNTTDSLPPVHQSHRLYFREGLKLTQDNSFAEAWYTSYDMTTAVSGLGEISGYFDAKRAGAQDEMHFETTRALKFGESNGVLVLQDGAFTLSFKNAASAEQYLLHVDVDADPAFLRVQIDRGADGNIDFSDRLGLSQVSVILP